MKRFFISGLAGLMVGLLFLGWGWRQWTGSGPSGPLGEASVQVRIPPGMTLSAAADTLKSRGLIAHPRVLLLGAKLAGKDRSLRAGLYELAYGQSPVQLLSDLTSGLSVQVSVTIPEGLVSHDIARALAAAFHFSPTLFLAVADSLARQAATAGDLLLSPAVVATLDSLAAGDSDVPSAGRVHWSEGLLAPDTYLFAEGSTAQTVATVLLETQLDRLVAASVVAQEQGGSGLAPFELLTLASLVETEARRDDERALIAAVYTNRLQKNWRLEADPTVAFILGKQGERLFFKDLKVESPYNTYRVKGLPPAPIATPGMASLLAAARPDSSSPALYFVSDGADGHVFSRTAREHEAAVQRFKAARDRQRRQRSR